MIPHKGRGAETRLIQFFSAKVLNRSSRFDYAYENEYTTTMFLLLKFSPTNSYLSSLWIICSFQNKVCQKKSIITFAIADF